MMCSTIYDLQDDQLIDIYHRAKELELDTDFIMILEEALEKREISKDKFSLS